MAKRQIGVKPATIDGSFINADKTPSELLTTLLNLYPEAGEAFVDCYHDVDAFNSIVARAQLLGYLFNMAHIAGLITEDEHDLLARSFGVAKGSV